MSDSEISTQPIMNGEIESSLVDYLSTAFDKEISGLFAFGITRGFLKLTNACLDRGMTLNRDLSLVDIRQAGLGPMFTGMQCIRPLELALMSEKIELAHYFLDLGAPIENYPILEHHSLAGGAQRVRVGTQDAIEVAKGQKMFELGLENEWLRIYERLKVSGLDFLAEMGGMNTLLHGCFSNPVLVRFILEQQPSLAFLNQINKEGYDFFEKLKRRQDLSHECPKSMFEKFSPLIPTHPEYVHALDGVTLDAFDRGIRTNNPIESIDIHTWIEVIRARFDLMELQSLLPKGCERKKLHL